MGMGSVLLPRQAVGEIAEDRTGRERGIARRGGWRAALAGNRPRSWQSPSVARIVANCHRQERAITAFVAGATLDEAAAAAGVSRRTISRWRQDPGFISRLQAVGQGALTEARSMLKACLPKAVSTLAALLTSTDDAIRLRAASVLIKGLQPEQPADAEAVSPQSQGRVMLVPAEHLEIVGAAFDRNARPGDPTVVLLPMEDEHVREAAEVDPQ